MRDRYICTEHSGHAGRALIGVFSSVYSENVICDPSCWRELLPEHSVTDPDHESLSVMYLNTIEQVELCKIAHTTRYVDNLVDALCIRCTKYNGNFS